jgi:hypothetical protein
MEIIISANNAFCKWLNLDLPRVQTTEGNGVGVQPLFTNANRVSWQVQALKKTMANTENRRDVIVVEAYSRYTMIFANMEAWEPSAFEDALLYRWNHELIHQMLRANKINEGEVGKFIDQFDATPFDFHWIQNTDMSVNGHLSDAQYWLESIYNIYGYNCLNLNETLALSADINSCRKKAILSRKPKKYERFYPEQRFVADGLWRFTNKNAPSPHAQKTFNRFPHPYKLGPSKAQILDGIVRKPKARKIYFSDNVVSIDELRKAKALKRRKQ